MSDSTTGRPPKDTEARTVPLSVRITPDLFERLRDAAAARRFTLTDLIIFALERGLNPPGELPDPFDEDFGNRGPLWSPEFAAVLAEHRGEWVAVVGPPENRSLAACGASLRTTVIRAQKAGYAKPLLFKVPVSELPRI